MPLVILLFIGYLAWFGLVLRRRLRADAARFGSREGRWRRLGLGALIITALPLLAGAWGAIGELLVLGAPGLALAVWTFAPRVVTSKIQPLSLVALGLDGFLRLRDYERGVNWYTRYGLTTRAQGALYPQLLLLQAYLFIGVGLWLLWRSIDRDGRYARLVLTVPARLEGQRVRPRWGLLLLPVAGMYIEWLGPRSWLYLYWWTGRLTMLVVLAAVAVVIWLPAVAADLTLAGLTFFGLNGVALGIFWPTHVLLPAVFTSDVRYGAVLVDSRTSAIAAGIEGLVLLTFAAKLLPRALDDRTRALLRSAADRDLAIRVVGLTRTRAEAVDSAAAELRRLERDLHDGPQARLVALGMSLRAAERLIPTSPQAAVALVAEAREKLGQGAGRAARPGARDLPAGARRPRPGRRGQGTGARHPAAHRGSGRPDCQARAGGRDRLLLRDRRSAGQRGQARRRDARPGADRAQ